MADSENSSIGKLVITGGGNIGTLASVNGLSVKHKQMGILTQSIFTLTDVAQSVINGTEYQSTKLFDFPVGFISIEGIVLSLAQKTTSVLASTINASSSGVVGIDKEAATNTGFSPLAGSSFTSSSVINVAGAAVVGGGTGSTTIIDGHSTAGSLYLCSSYPTTAQVNGNGTQTFTGTVIVTWLNLGDV